MSNYSEAPGVGKPGKVQAIAIMTLVDGILNIVWGLFLGIMLLLLIIPTIGIILCFTPAAIYSIVVGILEIIAGAKLMRTPPRKFKVKTIAILEIVNIVSLSFPSLVVGILNMVFYNDPETQAYIESLPE
jgi:hypothetical protein